jgi:hypothetical protein
MATAASNTRRYAIQLVTIPLLTGFIVSRALADPVLNFTLEVSKRP